MTAPEARSLKPEAGRPQAWPIAYFATALLVLAFHYRLALPGRALVGNDFRALFIALRAGLQQTLRAGDFPLWQRGMFFGYPVLGDIQFQIFNPLTWLTMPLDPARGVTVQSLCELCLCAVGMAFWMKQRGLRPVEGVFAGVAFALSLKQTVHLHHWTFAGSTCAWPWMLAGLDGFAASGRRRFLALTAVATAGTWIGSSPQMAYFGTGLAFLYALTLAATLRPEKVSGKKTYFFFAPRVALLLAVPLGAALAAPLLLPVLELNALGPRGAGITYRFAASWSWPGRAVWEAMLLPRAWGGRPDYRGPMNYWEVQGYLGLLPMALLSLSPLRRRALWLFAAVLVLSIWLSFGDNGWLDFHYRLFRFLPGYGGFRNPTRALMLAMFCAAVLAAEALGRLRDEPKLRARLLAGLAVLGACVVLCAALPAGYFQEALRADALWAALLLVAMAAWAVFSRADPRWAALAIPLYLADVALQTWDSPEIGASAAENHALEPLAARVPPSPEPRRVAVLLDWGEANNATYARGWEGVTGYGPTPLARVLRLFEATWHGHIRPTPALNDDENFPRFRPDSPLVPLFGAPLVAANLEANQPSLARDGQVRLYALPALPRVFWTGAWTALPDAQAGPALPAAARGVLAVLPEPVAQASGPQAGPVAAEHIEVHTNTLRASIAAPSDGLLVVLEPFFPGWRATLDGLPLPLLRADYAFMAVPVKAGRHVLELVYFPDRVLPGLLIAILALALLLVLIQRVDSGSTGGYFPPP